MSFSTFETLPDEILIPIIRYAGDALNIMRTFLGLNRRFTRIVFDREVRLLTNYLHLKPSEEYYNSNEFHQATRQLSSTMTRIDDEKFIKILRPLISYSIEQRYAQVTKYFRSSRQEFKSVRQTLSENELAQVDKNLREAFLQLKKDDVTTEAVRRIKKLVLTQGACLACSDSEWGDFHRTSLVMDRHSPYLIGNDERKLRWHLKLYSLMTQIFAISNPELLNYRIRLSGYLCEMEYFLFLHLFGSQTIWNPVIGEAMNGQHNEVILDLLFLSFCCYSTPIAEAKHLLSVMLESLKGTKTKVNHCHIRVIQVEMIKFIYKQCNTINTLSDDWNNIIIATLEHLSREKRFDILNALSHQYNDENFGG